MKETTHDVQQTILLDKPNTVEIRVRLMNIVDGSLVEDVIGGTAEIRLPKDMFDVFCGTSQTREASTSFHLSGVDAAKREHVDKMLGSFAQSLVEWICKEHTIDGAKLYGSVAAVNVTTIEDR